MALTESGLKKFGRPAHKGFYKGCDVAIRTPLWNFWLTKFTLQKLIEELARRVTHQDPQARPHSTN